MNSQSLLKALVYLDTGYIADLYEVVSGESPKTQITKNQGKKAGAQIPIFSAEVSAQESRSFPVSTFTMLATTLPSLDKEATLDTARFEVGMQSQYGWLEGELTVFKVNSNILDKETGNHKILATDALYQIRQKPSIDIALITTPEYFSPGIGTFVKLQETLLKKMSIPVRAYMRVTAAQSHMNQWVAVPLVILERRHG